MIILCQEEKGHRTVVMELIATFPIGNVVILDFKGKSKVLQDDCRSTTALAWNKGTVAQVHLSHVRK